MATDKIAIKAENLSKRYRIGVKQKMNDSLGAAMISVLKSPIENYRKYRSLYVFNDTDSEDTIWALKNISFDLHKGEVLGIIGHNGSGKSTLLKILSRVTDPTEGSAEIRGRVSSLLEVGTGFHPELTGRENIYLNAIILGMSKKEVDRKFDEIVAFSEVDNFIDTPVKRYSSGMKVRLAFAVSAYLDPQILIVDEVLAVGDAAFQKKCLGKMENVASAGKTVLFVSHNMAAIQSLCTRGIILEKGKLIADLPVEKAVQGYIASAQERANTISLAARDDRSGGDVFRFTRIDFIDPDTLEPVNVLISGGSMVIRIRYRCNATQILKDVSVSIGFFLSPGTLLFTCRSDVVGKTFQVESGEGELFCQIPKCPLMAGRYSFNLLADRPLGVLDRVGEAGFIDVEKGDFYGTGKMPAYKGQGVLVKYNWFDQLNSEQDLKCY
ncbi:MAG: ABC transporter ATP-binding protein [Pseudomonadota bacterium]